MRYTSWILAIGMLLGVACNSSTSPYGSSGGSGGGYGGGGGGVGAGGRSTTITVGNNFFSPTPDTIAAATGAVSFEWTTPSNGHGVTWDSGPGGDVPPNAVVASGGTSFFVTGLRPGRYEFHCPVHGGPGTGMHGSIVVQ